MHLEVTGVGSGCLRARAKRQFSARRTLREPELLSLVGHARFRSSRCEAGFECIYLYVCVWSAYGWYSFGHSFLLIIFMQGRFRSYRHCLRNRCSNTVTIEVVTVFILRTSCYRYPGAGWLSLATRVPCQVSSRTIVGVKRSRA